MVRRPTALLEVLLLSVMLVYASGAGAIVNGQVESGYECVGVLEFQGFPICSGTLIDPEWVLTSAACLTETPEWTPPDEFVMGFDASAPGARHHSVGEIVPHPDFTPDLNRDFGLVHLAAPAPGEPTCPTASTPDGLIQNGSVLHVGYGATSVVGNPTGIRRSRSAMLADLQPEVFPYDGSTGGPCWGDEGGPAFRDGVVVGVVSFTNSCGALGVDGRVASVQDSFIEPTLAGGSEVPVLGPAATAVLMSLMAAAGISRLRRRGARTPTARSFATRYPANL